MVVDDFLEFYTCTTLEKTSGSTNTRFWGFHDIHWDVPTTFSPTVQVSGWDFLRFPGRIYRMVWKLVEKPGERYPLGKLTELLKRAIYSGLTH